MSAVRRVRCPAVPCRMSADQHRLQISRPSGHRPDCGHGADTRRDCEHTARLQTHGADTRGGHTARTHGETDGHTARTHGETDGHTARTPVGDVICDRSHPSDVTRPVAVGCQQGVCTVQVCTYRCLVAADEPEFTQDCVGRASHNRRTVLGAPGITEGMHWERLGLG